jgi:hypothetical protein
MVKSGDVLGLVISLAAIAIGLFGNEFYFAKGIAIAASSSKRAPIWLGRALFIAAGSISLIVQIVHLLSD